MLFGREFDFSAAFLAFLAGPPISSEPKLGNSRGTWQTGDLFCEGSYEDLANAPLTSR